MLAEQVARARVGVVEHAAVELREEARRRRKLVRVARRAAHQRDADDGHALLDRRDQLEQAVRPLQHRRRLHEHDAARLGDVLLQPRQVAEVVRVEEALLAQALRELALQVARLEGRVRLRVRDERGVLEPLAPKHVPRGLFRPRCRRLVVRRRRVGEPLARQEAHEQREHGADAEREREAAERRSQVLHRDGPANRSSQRASSQIHSAHQHP